jgi:hypothetical protein
MRTACNRFRCGTASVAAKTHHFEDFSDLRVSDLRAVNCTSIIGTILACPARRSQGRGKEGGL